ncbi:EAL domain-containing protein [Paracoccus suum]|uniref:EAL domain-containing protein n=1 Tax=Paracoccus suum TaxID=2259340 RepID=A0A344PHE2_9RHOB|nr:EAL domain-containing protein [Paracoccus suum]AXC48797.1 EAL domain-containing protein [Paracoccus suum]
MDDGHDRALGSSPVDQAMAKQARLTMATVRRAVDRRDAVLAFQPVVQADRPSRAAFHEGLIRIIDETGRFVPLRDFMPQAETTDLGRRIDCLSLALGLEALAEDPAMRLSINMSARSIGYPDWLATMQHFTGGDDRITERLVLEITESSAMDEPELVTGFMRDWQARGVSFALDDFGAGYTSFRYLRDFNFDMIKVDGQFVREIASRPDNQVLTQALIRIAHHFDMFTVAESVETADDAAFLIQMGVDCLQGFYFGAPTIVPPWRTPNASARR